MRSRFPSATTALLTSAQCRTCGGAQELATFLTPRLKQLVEALCHCGFLDYTFPSTARPWAKPSAGQRLKKIKEVRLQDRMRFNQDCQPGNTGGLHIEGISSDDAAPHSI